MPSFPFARFWIINSEELERATVGEILETTKSCVHNYLTYRFQFYCDQLEADDTGIKLALVFTLKENIRSYKAKYNVCIESANYSEDVQFLYDKSCGNSINICSIDDLYDATKKYLIDGQLIVKIYGTIECDDPVLDLHRSEWIGHELGEQLWAMRDTTKDFDLVVNKQSIGVHKNVLVARSDVFAAMLRADMKEAQEGKCIITNFSFDTVFIAVQIMYERDFTTHLSLDSLLELWALFDYYHILSLKDLVESKIIPLFHQSNVVKTMNYILPKGEGSLKEMCMKYLNFLVDGCVPIADFDNLDKEIVFQLLKNRMFSALNTQR